jgi:hypothetical protein
MERLLARLETAVDTAEEGFATRAGNYDALLAELSERLDWARAGGGEAMLRRHRERNKIPVRDRIDLLIDPGTGFLELTPLAAWGLYDNELASAGIVTGIGTVRGTACMIIANDATVKGGSFHRETVKKHIRAQDIAAQNHAAFTPSTAQVAWAEEVVAAMAGASGGVARLDGRMLDAPHLAQARKLLARAQRT